MHKVTFGHNGATYTVRTKTGRDEYLYNATLYDVAKAVCDVKGIDTEHVPLSLDMLITQFVRWVIVTDIQDSALPVCQLYEPAVVGFFDAWVQATLDAELWAKWQQAYNQAQRVADDPLAAAPAPTNTSA
jgi:hypothetical protein